MVVPGTKAQVAGGSTISARTMGTSSVLPSRWVMPRVTLVPGVAAHELDDLLDRPPLGRLAVDARDEVTRTQARLVRRGAIEDRGDERLAGSCVDHDADTRDATRDLVGLGLDLIGCQEHGVAGVAERRHHAPDGAPGQVLVAQLAGIDIAVLDELERLPEDTEVLRRPRRHDTSRPAGLMTRGSRWVRRSRHS